MRVKRGLFSIGIGIVLVIAVTLFVVPFVLAGSVGTPCNYVTYSDTQCNPSKKIYCINNVCKQQTNASSIQPYCTDPDGMNTSKASGVQYRYRDYTGQIMQGQQADRCTDVMGRTVTYCQLNCKVMEFICKPMLQNAVYTDRPQQPQTSPNYQYFMKNCTGECSNGACVVYAQRTTPPTPQPAPQPTVKPPPETCNDNNVCTKDIFNATRRHCQFTSIHGCCRQNSECGQGYSCVRNKCQKTTTPLPQPTKTQQPAPQPTAQPPSESQPPTSTPFPTPLPHHQQPTIPEPSSQQSPQPSLRIPSRTPQPAPQPTAQPPSESQPPTPKPLPPSRPHPTPPLVTECQSTEDCDDNNKCTYDSCAQGRCIYKEVPYCLKETKLQKLPMPWENKDTTQCQEDSYLCYPGSKVAYECVNGKWLAVKAQDHFCSQVVCRKGDYMCIDDQQKVTFCNSQKKVWEEPTSEKYNKYCEEKTPTGYAMISISGRATDATKDTTKGSVVMNTQLLAGPNIPRRIFRVVPLQKEQCEIKDITYITENKNTLIGTLQNWFSENTVLLGALALLLVVAGIMGSFFLGEHYGKTHK